MPEHSETVAATSEEQATTEAQTRMAMANERVASFLVGAQKLMLEEFVFASNALVERAQTEVYLLSELASKMAGAHSVEDVRTMYEECGKHQLEFIRRDYNRLFKNGERVIEATSNLFKSHPLN